MNKIFKYALLGAVVLGLSACSEDQLNTTPTDSMSGETLLADATNALVPLNGIYRSMYTPGWTTTGNIAQTFGISAYNLMAEVMGDDMIMGAMGSGWFWYDAVYNMKSFYTRSTFRSYDLWKAYYTWIANANYIIAAQSTMAGDAKAVDYVMGQAYAIRAYSYFMLEQSFARNYANHKTEPGVPLYTGPTFTSTTGQPRATNQEVYDQINSDINKAVELLQGTSQQDVSHIGYAVALGLKARIALTEQDWTTAADAAVKAIAASGKEILPVKDFAGMNSVKANNVMWGAKIVTDQAGKYASLFAMMDTAVSYGKKAPKQINLDLYNHMSKTDTRRAWWDPNSPYTTGAYEQDKFHFSNATTWEGDYVWMRVEEMYLIAAEAYCHAGDDAQARQYLSALMAKRDPNFDASQYSGSSLPTLTSDQFTGAYAHSLLNEIILQRRIELWGEAGRIYDIRRLEQGFRRTSAQGFPTGELLTTRPTDNPESYMWVLTIPQAEFDGNANMNASTDQNPVGDLK